MDGETLKALQESVTCLVESSNNINLLDLILKLLMQDNEI